MPRSGYTICTSEQRPTSTTVSHGFVVERYSSPPFGSHGPRKHSKPCPLDFRSGDPMQEITPVAPAGSRLSALQRHTRGGSIDPAWASGSARLGPRGVSHRRCRTPERRPSTWGHWEGLAHCLACPDDTRHHSRCVSLSRLACLSHCHSRGSHDLCTQSGTICLHLALRFR